MIWNLHGSADKECRRPDCSHNCLKYRTHSKDIVVEELVVYMQRALAEEELTRKAQMMGYGAVARMYVVSLDEEGVGVQETALAANMKVTEAARARRIDCR